MQVSIEQLDSALLRAHVPQPPERTKLLPISSHVRLGLGTSNGQCIGQCTRGRVPRVQVSQDTAKGAKNMAKVVQRESASAAKQPAKEPAAEAEVRLVHPSAESNGTFACRFGSPQPRRRRMTATGRTSTPSDSP